MSAKTMIWTELDQDENLLSVEMIRPSNFHAHLRSEELMQAVAWHIMRWVKYLLVMPNTGPIDTLEKVIDYWRTLCKLRDIYNLKTEFVMTLYLTEKLTPNIINLFAGSMSPFRFAVKYYPPKPGATTGAGYGIPLKAASETLHEMAVHNIPLLGHFESTEDRFGRDLPHALREGYFLRNEFPRLREKHPDLKICIEHASTELAVKKVLEDPSMKTVCTITPQHLLFTRSDMHRVSWKNHLKCMPFVKTPDDRAALLELATRGDPRAILGDDTAPHPSLAKHGSFEDAACGAWLPHSLSLYIMAFHQAGALDDRFIKFACLNGPNWWELSRPDFDDRVCVVRDVEHDIPDPTSIPNSDDAVIPLGWTTEDDRLSIGHALAETD